MSTTGVANAPSDRTARILGQQHHTARAKGGRFTKKPDTYRRPSDGQPSGAPFDIEEYETRKADRRASDPEFQRRVAAIKLRRRAEHNERTLTWDIENANRDLAETKALSCSPEQRHARIWRAVRDAQPPQRIRGIGAAAKRAGY